MPSIINTNITSLIAQNNLTKTGDMLQTTIQRLSSGLRVNNAADDASGFAIANRMDSQIRGMAVATRNANDAISFSQTASGALTQISNNLQRMRELAVQAANGSNSASDTSLLNQEFSQLQTEVSRIQGSTTFNNVNVFTSTDTIFQIGANTSANDRVNMQGTALTSTMSLGTQTITDRAATSAYTDISSAVNAAFTASGSSISSVRDAAIDAINSSQKLSFSVKNNLLSTINSASSSAVANGMTLANFNTALNLNLAGTTTQTYGVATTFPAITTLGNIASGAGVIGAYGTGTGATLASVYSQVNTYITASTAGATDKTNVASAVTTAYNAAVAGNMTATSFASTMQTAISGLLVTATSATFGFQVASTASDTGSSAGSLGNTPTATVGQTNAQNAINALDNALTEVNTASAVQGALQNRFSAVISNLTAFSQSQTAAKSRIVDADFAAETAKLSKSQILQQAGTAMLAQANQLPSGVLSLLK
jgi:flagellin